MGHNKQCALPVCWGPGAWRSGEWQLCSYAVDVCFLADITGLSYLGTLLPEHLPHHTAQARRWGNRWIPSLGSFSDIYLILWIMSLCTLSWKSRVSFLDAKWDCGSLHREQPLCTSCDHLDSGTVIPPSWQWRIGNVCPSHLIKHSHTSEHGPWIFSSLFW